MTIRPMYTTKESHPCTAERHEFGVIPPGVDAMCRCGAKVLRGEDDSEGVETILLPKKGG